MRFAERRQPRTPSVSFDPASKSEKELSSMKPSAQLVLSVLRKLVAIFEEKRRAQLERLAFFSVQERRNKRVISILVTPDGLGWRDLLHEVRSSNLKFFPEATEMDTTIVDEIWQCIEHPHLFSFAMPANGVAVRNAES